MAIVSKDKDAKSENTTTGDTQNKDAQVEEGKEVEEGKKADKDALDKSALPSPSPEAKSEDGAESVPEQKDLGSVAESKTSADKSKSPNAASFDAKTNDPEVAQESATKKASGPSLILPIIIILVIAAGGYFGWRYLDNWLQHGQEANSALRDQLDSQHQVIADLKRQFASELSSQQERLAQQEAVISQLQLRMTSQASRLRDLSTATRDDWLLAEAEYLLRLANQRLLTERTTENPVALLLAADEILKEFDDPDLFAVRKQVAADITALRLASVLDREGLYLQLVALADVIPQLQLMIKPWDEAAEEVAQVLEAEQERNWGQRLGDNVVAFFGGLDNYIRINDRSAPTEPLLSPDEEVYLRHNLGMMLEQAQLALLREEADIYRTSLQKSRDWLAQYFQMNPKATLFQQQIDELITQPVDIGVPDISASLEGLRSYINLWHLRHQGPAEASASTGSEELAQ